jgi:type II secretory pathway component PulJ
VEILVATTLSLILLGAVVRMFGDVGQSITDSRSMLEAADRLRLTAARLQQDLAGVTVTMSPPRKPENNEGYFEYIEGPVGTTPYTAGGTQMTAPSAVAINTDVSTTQPDSTVGDFDDILMFTTRSTGQPFVGRNGIVGAAIQSDVAEVAWFVRGRTLYRRVLLVAPSAFTSIAGAGFYANYDISVRSAGAGNVTPNTLGDLTKRENRFAHPIDVFPFDVRRWQWSSGTTVFPTLPTLRECSSTGWIAGVTLPPSPANSPTAATLDFWTNDATKRVADNAMIVPLGILDGSRIADDVILTNVIGFDVKAWDPMYPLATGGNGAYVDLGYNNAAYAPGLANSLSHWGHQKSGLNPTNIHNARVYDTYSFHYEAVGTGLAGGHPGRAINGFDDPDDSGVPNGIVDDIVYNGASTAGENETAPPYPIPLRGIQVKIRVFEPDSRQVREVTVVQDFLSQ